MMECKDCYWRKRNSALREEKICCNKESPNYNQILGEGGCELGETKQAVDYKNMTAWEFASKYYM